jgi:hypothetical protein
MSAKYPYAKTLQSAIVDGRVFPLQRSGRALYMSSENWPNTIELYRLQNVALVRQYANVLESPNIRVIRVIRVVMVVRY